VHHLDIFTLESIHAFCLHWLNDATCSLTCVASQVVGGKLINGECEALTHASRYDIDTLLASEIKLDLERSCSSNRNSIKNDKRAWNWAVIKT
jgi:hypothetical protein